MDADVAINGKPAHANSHRCRCTNVKLISIEPLLIIRLSLKKSFLIKKKPLNAKSIGYPKGTGFLNTLASK